jgi:hypothetical protein
VIGNFKPLVCAEHTEPLLILDDSRDECTSMMGAHGWSAMPQYKLNADSVTTTGCPHE